MTELPMVFDELLSSRQVRRTMLVGRSYVMDLVDDLRLEIAHGFGRCRRTMTN
jgi:hypothetical protein